MSLLHEKKVVSYFTEFLEKQNKFLIDFTRSKEYPLFKFIEEIIRERNDKQLSILDVGCGIGHTLESINRFFPGNKLYGIDITPSLIEFAKKYRNPEINFKIGSVLNLPYRDNSFDIVFAENVLHHLVSSTREKSKKLVEVALKECARVLKNGGYILVDECLVRDKFNSYLLFYISNIWSRIGFFEIPMFEMNKNVIVSFLTFKEFMKIIENVDFNTICKTIKIWKPKNITEFIKQKLLHYVDRNVYYMGKICK
jgi:ubiquinone/menaquinone biosynthesis C-methylase UbiE